MNKKTYIFSFLIAFTLHSHAEVCTLPATAYEAQFSGSYKGWKVKMQRTVKAMEEQPENWQLLINAKVFGGKITEFSNYLPNPDGSITPLEYSYTRKVIAKKREQMTHFDWENKLAIASGREEGEIELEGDELDRLNHELILRCRLQAGERDITLSVIDKEEKKDFKYVHVKDEMLETELGTLDTVVMQRQRRNGHRVTTIWFAKDKQFAIVKLLQEEKKDQKAYLLNIKSLEFPTEMESPGKPTIKNKT